MTAKQHQVYDHYFFNESAYDYHDGGYVKLEEPDVPASRLNIPAILAPDQETDTDVWYTVTAQTGETQLLPGEKKPRPGAITKVFWVQQLFLRVAKTIMLL